MSSQVSALSERRWADRLSVHVGLLGCVLLVLLCSAELRNGFSVDEGSYAIQAHALRDGSWDIHWPLRSLDPEGRYFPYDAGRLTADGAVAYVSHPAWPAALAVTTSAFGELIGLRVLSLLSVFVAAITGFFMASTLAGRAAAPWGFWLVGASPLLVNGLMIWAHAPGIALGGLAALAAMRVLEGSSRRWPWLVLPTALSAGVLVRGESLPFALALLAALIVFGFRRQHRKLLMLASLGAVAISLAYALERIWITSIIGTELGTELGYGLSERAGSDDGWVVGRLLGATVVLILGGVSALTLWTTLTALLLVGLAVRASGRPDVRVRPTPLLFGAGGLMVVRLFVGVEETVYGLLVAWPLALLALIAVKEGRSTHRLLGLIGGLFLVGVLVTQSDVGGGSQWGGRFLSPILVPLGALMAAAVVSSRFRIVERQAIAAVALTCALASVVITEERRRINARGMDLIADTGARTALTKSNLFARLDWREWPERCWLAANDDLPGALAVLRQVGGGKSAYLGFSALELRRAGARVTVADPQLKIGAFQLSRSAITDCPSPGG